MGASASPPGMAPGPRPPQQAGMQYQQMMGAPRPPGPGTSYQQMMGGPAPGQVIPPGIAQSPWGQASQMSTSMGMPGGQAGMMGQMDPRAMLAARQASQMGGPMQSIGGSLGRPPPGVPPGAPGVPPAMNQQALIRGLRGGLGGGARY